MSDASQTTLRPICYYNLNASWQLHQSQHGDVQRVKDLRRLVRAMDANLRVHGPLLRMPQLHTHAYSTTRRTASLADSTTILGLWIDSLDATRNARLLSNLQGSPLRSGPSSMPPRLLQRLHQSSPGNRPRSMSILPAASVLRTDCVGGNRRSSKVRFVVHSACRVLDAEPLGICSVLALEV